MNNDNNNIDNDITIPQSITENMPENKTIFTISSIISIITCLISIFGLNQISFTYRIIICLSVICFVLLFNVIFLYIKEREHYYQVCYNIALCKAFNKKMNEIKAENENLKSKIHYV